LRPLDAALRDELGAALGAEPVAATPPWIIDVGPVWLIANLGGSAAVHALAPDMAAVSRLSHALGLTGVTVFGRDDGGANAIYVRSFAPAHGVPEDPVCGSGNACVAAFLRHAGLLAPGSEGYVAGQGHELGRDGRVWVRFTPALEIGGASVTCVDGELRT